MGEEESSGTRVVKLLAVVALDGLVVCAELGCYIGKEVSKCRDRVRFHT